LNHLVRVFLLFLMIGTALGQASQVAAQDQPAGRILLSTPDTAGFPAIQFRMEVFDSEGRFVSGLKPEDLQIIEETRFLTPDQVALDEVGLQVTVAFNAQSSMTNQSNGETQFSQIRSVLAEWVGRQPPDSPDDFSLATPTGLHLIRSREVEQWRKTIEEYQPDLLRLQPGLTSLADALDLATDPLDRPLMKRAIVFITPALPPSLLATIPDYTSRARQIGVKVFVWLIAPSADPASAAPGPLEDLAIETGGKFQILPSNAIQQMDLESQLIHMRHAYQVQYTSQVKESGAHDLQVKVINNKLNLSSNVVDLYLTVLPPNPIFLSPPASLNFEMGETETNDTQPVGSPGEVPLSIVVEFPDQHQRELKATRLYVNGILVAENVKPPFDRFVWKIAEISKSGPHMLRVEALDSLNLSGASLEIPVDVIIEQAEVKSSLVTSPGRMVIAVGAVVVSGGAVAVLLLRLRRRNRPHWWNRNAPNRSKEAITQPSPRSVSQAEASVKNEPPSHPRPAATVSAPARLINLTETEQPVPGGSIQVYADELTFGSDPERSTQVLESSTVDGLHARLFLDEKGDFCLADNQTVAGTWINYAPVALQGVRLEHGDLVHIGRVMFRFELSDPAHACRREIVIYPSEERNN
jgi:hypothetical protein